MALYHEGKTKTEEKSHVNNCFSTNWQYYLSGGAHGFPLGGSEKYGTAYACQLSSTLPGKRYTRNERSEGLPTQQSLAAPTQTSKQAATPQGYGALTPLAAARLRSRAPRQGAGSTEWSRHKPRGCSAFGAVRGSALKTAGEPSLATAVQAPVLPDHLTALGEARLSPLSFPRGRSQDWLHPLFLAWELKEQLYHLCNQNWEGNAPMKTWAFPPILPTALSAIIPKLHRCEERI